MAALLLVSLMHAAEATPAGSLLIDLDGDGRAETSLSVAPCHQQPAKDCLLVRKPGVALDEIVLTAGAAERDLESTDLHLQGPRLVDIGNHVGGRAPEIAVLSAERDSVKYHGVLSVVDVQALRVVGQAQSPRGLFNVFVDAARGPDGRRIPFLAPSFGASTDPAPELGTAGEWDYVCSFSPGASDSRCGPGFVAIDIGAGRASERGRSYYFREVGGFLQDLDGDGWQDVNLIYHFEVRAVSLAKHSLIDSVHYDISADPATLNRERLGAVAHSGRNYGTHVAVDGPGDTRRDVIVAGAPVDAFGKSANGEFRDLYCNVSRFVAVLESRAGQPRTRRLAWARYFGFDSSSFVNLPKADDGGAAIRDVSPLLRRGDFMNGCLHRYSDSRLQLHGRALVAVNAFSASEPQLSCEAEQYQLYFKGWSRPLAGAIHDGTADAQPWSAFKQRAWNRCKAQNIGRRGSWALQLFDEGSGALVGTLNGYVWGWSDLIVPHAVVALVEEPGDGASFDFTWELAQNRPRVPARLTVRVIDSHGWKRTWALPSAARPRMERQKPGDTRGIGDYTYFAELTTEDIDGDGLLDLELDDGSWVGFSSARDAFVCKRGCGPTRNGR